MIVESVDAVVTEETLVLAFLLPHHQQQALLTEAEMPLEDLIMSDLCVAEVVRICQSMALVQPGRIA